MQERTSSCAKAWGLCLRDARCPDTACEGHPALTCATCVGGPCRTPEACRQPEQPCRPKTLRTDFGIAGPFFAKTKAGRARLISAALGGAGFLYILGAVVRHLWSH